MVDSDFSIDENDEPVSDPDDEEGKSRKRKATSTKAYREPMAKKAKTTSSKSPSTSQQRMPTTKTTVRAVKKTPAAERTPTTYTVMDSGNTNTACWMSEWH